MTMMMMRMLLWQKGLGCSKEQMMNDWSIKTSREGRSRIRVVSNNADVKLHFDTLVNWENAQNSFYQPEILIMTTSTKMMLTNFLLLPLFWGDADQSMEFYDTDCDRECVSATQWRPRMTKWHNLGSKRPSQWILTDSSSQRVVAEKPFNGCHYLQIYWTIPQLLTIKCMGMIVVCGRIGLQNQNLTKLWTFVS